MFFVLAETNEIVGWVDAILSVLAILTAILMTFFILLQEGKGGGLAALGGTKAAGVEGVTNPIRRATGYLAAMFFVMIIILGIMHKPTQSILGDTTTEKGATEEKEKQDKATEAPPPGTAEPVSAPAAAQKTDEKPPVKVEEKPAPKADEKAAAPKADEKADAAKPADAKPADAKAADAKAADNKPADAKAAENKPADTKAADAPKQDEPKKTENK
jgi:protein translocase SecG subunit